MVDINGVELQVGDSVIYTNRNISELRKGTIFKITKAKAIVQLSPPTNNSYTYPDGKVMNWISKNEDNIMWSDQVMKL